jgi:hypothetical protein
MTEEMPNITKKTHQQVPKSPMYFPKLPLAYLLKISSAREEFVGKQYLSRSIQKDI